MSRITKQKKVWQTLKKKQVLIFATFRDRQKYPSMYGLHQLRCNTIQLVAFERRDFNFLFLSNSLLIWSFLTVAVLIIEHKIFDTCLNLADDISKISLHICKFCRS